MRRTTLHIIELLIVAWLLVFVINLVPAFMPPTWSVLAFFLIRYDVPLLPLAIGGAVAASAGRWLLAEAARRWGRRLLSPGRLAGLDALGAWVSTRVRWAPPVAVLLYSFGPIPSNALFMAAGLTGMRLAPIAGAFFAGRLVSYTVLAHVADRVSDRVEDVFGAYWSNGGALAVQVLVLVALVAFTRVDWARLLRLPRAVPDGAATSVREPEDVARPVRETPRSP